MANGKPRRVVLIMTDSQGVDLLGCYGHPEMNTPHLDRLAAEGLRFDRAYTTCPLSTPARGALFTGLFPHSSGAWANEMPLGASIRTLGQRLTDHGIRAAYTGKWHLTALDYYDRGVCPEGWDPNYWFDGRNHLESLPDAMRTFVRTPQTRESMEQAGFTREMTFAHGVAERAVRFLEDTAESDEDFLLVASFDEPHHPWITPPPFCDMFGDYEFPIGPSAFDDLADKPVSQQRWAKGVAASGKAVTASGGFTHQPYFANNHYVDAEIGRVLEAIDRHAPDALVIYTSDHGEMMLSHGLNGKGDAMYEQITHVPLLVRWPGQIAPGSTCAAPASHIDITPTVLDFFGLDRPPILQGRSMLETFADPAAAGPRTVFTEFNRFSVYAPSRFNPIRSACDGRYKLAINLLYTDELYDLEADPHELVNLIESAEYRAVRDRLHRELLQWMDDTHDPLRCDQWGERHWGRTDFAFATRRVPRPPDGYEKPSLSYVTGWPYD